MEKTKKTVVFANTIAIIEIAKTKTTVVFANTITMIEIAKTKTTVVLANTITINGIDNTMVNKLRSINVDPLIVPLNIKNLLILIISFFKLFFVVLI